ncbi:MAG TPA: amidophosphoribosyltransferase, partial [Methanocorpusculum sp.]|nr:amidophosphoribosyltransferase [Methanocorpusculum sp.]
MCGIAGIVANSEVSGSLYWALYALQHRGQERGGISTYDNGIVHKYNGNGLV